MFVERNTLFSNVLSSSFFWHNVNIAIFISIEHPRTGIKKHKSNGINAKIDAACSRERIFASLKKSWKLCKSSKKKSNYLLIWYRLFEPLNEKATNLLEFDGSFEPCKLKGVFIFHSTLLLCKLLTYRDLCGYMN